MLGEQNAKKITVSIYEEGTGGEGGWSEGSEGQCGC